MCIYIIYIYIIHMYILSHECHILTRIKGGVQSPFAFPPKPNKQTSQETPGCRKNRFQQICFFPQTGLPVGFYQLIYLHCLGSMLVSLFCYFTGYLSIENYGKKQTNQPNTLPMFATPWSFLSATLQGGEGMGWS